MVTRLTAGLADAGGWGEHDLTLPPGEWQDALTGRVVVASEGAGGSVRVARVLADLPVALLVRHGTLGGDEHS